MRERSCCFSGHRPDKLSFGYDESHMDCAGLKQSLRNLIGLLIDSGYDTFYAGMAQGSDIFCAEAVLLLRREHPNIRLVAVVPYQGQEKYWSAEYQSRYRRILMEADETVILSDRYYRGCMMQRNRYMVERCRALVAIYSGESGGTKNTLHYAAKSGLTIYWFNPDTKFWIRMNRMEEQA